MSRTINIFILIFFIGISAPVHAYILSGPHIIELMTQNAGTVKSLLIAQRQIYFDQNEQQSAESFSGALRCRAPYACRCDIASDTVQRIHLHTADDALTVLDDRIMTDSVFDQYAELLFSETLQVIEKRLIRRGVDISISSLCRFEEKIAYVIGAQYPDETTTQIRIDKETFRKLRSNHCSDSPANMQKGNTGADEIQKTIENFSKIYE